MTHVSNKEFKTLNWLPVTERFNQRIDSIVFKQVNNQCPNYLNEVSQTAPENNIQTRGSFLKLKCTFCKTNADKWRCLTLVQPHGAKPLTHLSEQKISTGLSIILRNI